jgi:hypothetical protein
MKVTDLISCFMTRQDNGSEFRRVVACYRDLVRSVVIQVIVIQVIVIQLIVIQVIVVQLIAIQVLM